MSITILKQQIENFLNTKSPEVLAITGAWGVGKTFSWRKFLRKANERHPIALPRYSYVSLFGVNSLDALKYAIFENTISRDMIGRDVSVDTFKNNAIGLTERLGRKSLTWFRGAPIWKTFSPAIESLSFLSINGSLICIDDLERRGAGLHMKDVLGLVTQLKEQKSCKVALMLNINEDDLEDYAKYREKVVDVELEFSPTAEECANIAYDYDEPYMQSVAALTRKLDIRNIRVLKKIERMVRLARDLLIGYEPEITDQVLQSLVLFSWCYHSASDRAPTLDFVINEGYIFAGLRDDPDDKQDPKEGEWRTLLSSYGYVQTDQFDRVLAKAVKTGYFVDENFQREASQKNEEILAQKSVDSFSRMWQLYHDSFDDNRNELVDGLRASFIENARNITTANLNGTVQLFRGLGEDEKATEIIDFYIDQRRAETELFNLERNDFFGDTIDDEIKSKFEEVYKNAVIVDTAAQVLARISGIDGWNQNDELILANTSEQEYYDLFKTVRGDTLTAYVRTCLRFGQIGNATARLTEIANRARAALVRIGRESDLNRLRVSKYGINVDHEEAPEK